VRVDIGHFFLEKFIEIKPGLVAENNHEVQNHIHVMPHGPEMARTHLSKRSNFLIGVKFGRKIPK
jgi:hypothetical protein